jgi:hypothetical protein
LFAWPEIRLIWLVFCEKKTLLNGWLIWLIISNKQAIRDPSLVLPVDVELRRLLPLHAHLTV